MDRIPQIGRGSVRERIEDVITGLILDGSLPPGSRLPSELQLADKLGVSRVALREARMSLEAYGLLESIPGKGITITQPDSAKASQALRILLQRNAVSMADVVRTRVFLDIGVVEQACQRVTPDQLEALRCSVSEWSRPGLDLEALVAEDERFHQLLVEATGNAILGLMVRTISDIVHETRKTTLASGPGPDIEGHRAIVDALARRDPEAGRSAMAAHLKHYIDDLVSAGVERLGEDTRSDLMPLLPDDDGSGQ